MLLVPAAVTRTRQNVNFFCSSQELPGREIDNSIMQFQASRSSGSALDFHVINAVILYSKYDLLMAHIAG